MVFILCFKDWSTATVSDEWNPPELSIFCKSYNCTIIFWNWFTWTISFCLSSKECFALLHFFWKKNIKIKINIIEGKCWEFWARKYLCILSEIHWNYILNWYVQYIYVSYICINNVSFSCFNFSLFVFFSLVYFCFKSSTCRNDGGAYRRNGIFTV